MTSIAVLRGRVSDLLRRREYEAVLALRGSERRLVRAILSLLYDGEELIRWRAVTMIGRLAGAEPEMVRPLVTRFVWWMNNESGGIGWSSAPALGEIGRMAPELMEDTVRVVVHYREEFMLFPGVIWATGRLAATYPVEAKEVVPKLTPFLADADGALRGLAAWSLGQIGDSRARDGLIGLLGDAARCTLYEDEYLAAKETGTIAAEALKRISA